LKEEGGMNILNEDDVVRLKKFEDLIGIQFDSTERLFKALCHTSYVNESDRFENKDSIYSNERLEFLGDSVVGLVIVEKLFKAYPENHEGELARAKAVLASEALLAKLARKIELGQYMYLGHGEVLSGARDRESLLADGFEALCGAIYLDRGFEVVEKFILEKINEYINVVMKDSLLMDYKTKLQEMTQTEKKELPEYRLIEEKGPSHNPEFVFEIILSGRRYGLGRGKSKKEAEQMAAKHAIKELMAEKGL